MIIVREIFNQVAEHRRCVARLGCGETYSFIALRGHVVGGRGSMEWREEEGIMLGTKGMKTVAVDPDRGLGISERKVVDRQGAWW